VVPQQVAREFGKHRFRAMAGAFQRYREMFSKLPASVPEPPKHSLLDVTQEYRAVQQRYQEYQHARSAYKDSFEPLGGVIRSWYCDDPVSKLYGSLAGAIIYASPSLSREELIKDSLRRNKYSIPPGYRDSGKNDGGIGDKLIWHSLLAIGKARTLPTIFVTGDIEKHDWVHEADGQVLCARYELLDEYRRETKGQSFYIVALSQMLTLFKADEKSVKSVAAAEQERREDIKRQLDQVQETAEAAQTKAFRSEMSDIASLLTRCVVMLGTGQGSIEMAQSIVDGILASLRRLHDAVSIPELKYLVARCGFQVGALAQMQRGREGDFNNQASQVVREIKDFLSRT